MKKYLLAASSTLLVTLYSLAAFAQEGAPAAAGSNAFDKSMWAALSAGLAIGIAAFGGALAQGRVATAALDGIARNPGADAKIRTPMILGLALIESLVLYALIIAFFLQAKA